MKTKLICAVLLLAMLLSALCLPAFADGGTATPTTFSAIGKNVWKGILADGKVNYLSDLTFTGITSNTSFTPAKNAMYKQAADSGITLKNGETFKKGIGTHPLAKGAETPAWTEIDVSALTGYDTFYALFAKTSSATEANPIKGEVWVDTVGDGSAYTLVAESADITTKDDSVEFIIPMQNVKKIKLVTKATGDANSSCHCAWVNAALYKQNANAAYDGTYSSDASLAYASVLGGATLNYSIEDGALVIDNTNGGKDIGLQLVNKLPTTVNDYFVEATITLLSIKDCATDPADTRYAALCANLLSGDNYLNATVRYNGTINFEQRAGTYQPIAASATSNVSELTDPATAGLNQAFTLRVHFHNNTADLYVNGQKLMTGTNTVGAPTGAIGIMLKDGVKASVDNVRYVVNEYGDPAKLLIPNRAPSQNYETIVYDEVTNPYTDPYGTWMAGENTKYFLSDMDLSDSLCTGGRKAYKDDKYKGEVGAGWKLAQTHQFDKGLGVHPSASWSDEKDLGGGCYLNLDISAYTDPTGEYKCDTFYSAVGLTDSASAGVWFVLYGDKDDGNGFVQLACSDKIVGYNYGEMNVDIVGVKTLKLVVCADDLYNSSASYWGNTCIFKKDDAAVKPDYTVEEGGDDDDDDDIVTKETATTTKPEGNTTAKPSDDNTTAAPAKEEKGCASTVVGFGAILALCTLGTGAVVIRKKEED